MTDGGQRLSTTRTTSGGQVRALLRSRVRRVLTKFKYPPDKQESAIGVVMQQAQFVAPEVLA